MEHHQKFIDNLIALKSYYRKLIEEYKRQLTHATEQIECVNALLLDQFEQQYKQQQTNSRNQTESTASNPAIASTSEPSDTSPSSTVSTASASSHSAISSTSERSNASSSPVSLASIESAASNSAITSTSKPSNVSSPAVPAASEDDEPAIPEPMQQPVISDLAQLTLELEPKEPIDLLPKIDLLANSLPVEDLAISKPNLVSEVESASVKLPEPDVEPNENQSNSSSAIESNVIAETTTSQLPPQQPVDSLVAADSSPKRSRHVNHLKTPLLPQYEILTKSEAVEKFLQDNVGKVFYIDDITRAIHGNLGESAIRAERGRIYDTLFKGIAKGLWQAVPDTENYYTINLKSVEPTVPHPEPPSKISSKPKTSSRSKYSDSMLPRYQQLKFSEAVATVVQEKAGQVLTPERVTRELYGDVSTKDLTKFQDQVGKALWAGAKKERWQRVPGQLGQYTLDLTQLA